MKINEINILGRKYKVEYKNNPCEVDINNRESLFGQIDFWERIIRIYDNGRSEEELFEILLHEVLHGLFTDLNLEHMSEEDHNLLCIALADVLVRNNLIDLDINKLTKLPDKEKIE